MTIHIARNDQTFGPYTLDEVNAYLLSGHLTVQDLAWFEGCAGWMPVSQIAGVQLPTSSAPPPPPAFATQPMAPQQAMPHFAVPETEQTIFEITPTLTPDMILTVLTMGLWLLVLVPKAIASQGTRYKLTTQRLILTTGLAARRVEEFELYRIHDVTTSQGVLGRMLGFGTVVVHGPDASTPCLFLTNINNPLRVKEQIREQMRQSRRSEGVRAVEFG